MSWLSRWLHERSPSKQEWRNCPYCEPTATDCFWCGGHHQYYYFGPMLPTWAERLCPHWWVYEGKDSRFCWFCGRHEHRCSEMYEPWELVWNVKEAGHLPALRWWHSRSREHQNSITYGEMQDLYDRRKPE